MRLGFVLAFLFVAAPTLAQTSPPARGAATADAGVAKIAEAYVKATLAGDAKAIAALYTDDAIEMPPNQPALKGRAAIEQHYVKLFGDATMKLTTFTLDHIETWSSGTTGFDVGTYQQTVTLKDGKAVKESGKYTVILKRSGPDWKVAYAIYNGDNPPMPPAPKP